MIEDKSLFLTVSLIWWKKKYIYLLAKMSTTQHTSKHASTRTIIHTANSGDVQII